MHQSLYSIPSYRNQDQNTITNMKSFFVIALLVCSACAAPAAGPASSDADAVVVKYESDNIGVDGYSYAVETSNGIAQQEQGELVDAGTDDEALVVRGSYSYTGSDGVLYAVTYIADKNGFQPQGAHLPQA